MARRQKRRFERRNEMFSNLSNWVPKTNLGKKVMAGEITLDEIFSKGIPIKEPEIVDKLISNLKSEIILIGGSPGKGGGIRRTPTMRTVRMHRSGRRYKMTAMVVIGNSNGYIGLGVGAANDHRDAISKATEAAKLNIMPVRRSCGSWKCKCSARHSIPFKASGKRGSVRITLIPAPKGAGLMVSEETKKIMQLAGIKDIWSKIDGNSRNRRNMSFAVLDAFRNLNKMKIPFEFTETTVSEVESKPEESVVEAIEDVVEIVEEVIEGKESLKKKMKKDVVKKKK